MRKWLVPFTIVMCSAWQCGVASPVDSDTSMMAPNAPLQTMLQHAKTFTHNGYTIKPLADFDIEARLLHVHSYDDDRESQLSPIDFAVGWGPMSDPAVLSQIRVTQGNRFLYWQTDRMPVPRADIEHNIANLHLIPSNPSVASQLKTAAPGRLVRLKGYLVRVQARDGWHWVSSLTRTDVGKGACELLWVQKVEMPEIPSIPVHVAGASQEGTQDATGKTLAKAHD